MARLRNRVAHVRFDLPDDVDDSVVAGFICDALESWGGGLAPHDELFESLSVQHVRLGGCTYNNPKPKKFLGG